jgi:glyoxylase I family protein
VKVAGFHHVALQVRNLAPMVAFYRDVLGLPLLAEHPGPGGAPRSVWMGVPDAFIALETVAGELGPPLTPFRHGAPGWFLVAFRIAAHERAQVRTALQRAGVPVEHETRWTLYLRDPEGNRVGLSHHPDTEVDG